MADVRASVDAVDRELVSLLGERFALMSAAARIKPDRTQVRDEARKAAVLANVQRAAREHGVDPQLALQLWEPLVEASIAFELEAWDRLRQPAA